MNRLTKIIATISDKTATKESLTAMIEAGMNAIRLNTAHMTIEDGEKIVTLIRSVNPEIPIIIDTKGPEIRTTAVDEPILVKTGETIEIQADPTQKSIPGLLSVNYEDFCSELPPQAEILIDDGEISLTVVSKNEGRLQCRVNNKGIIGSRKSINVPKISINLPSLSDKDLDFIQFAAHHDIDFIAHSFVRNQDDVIVIQKLLEARHGRSKIIAKIENQEGVDNIDSILEHVFGIMIARGDLGIEISGARIPHIQKCLIQKAVDSRRVVIVATQMLYSMIERPRPTRAEVSDVANAIYDGADAIMLSGETAYGKYPIEAIKTMAEIAKEANSNIPAMRNIPKGIITSAISAHLTRSAVKASSVLNATAIIADSKSGRTIRALAAYRANKPVYAFCYDFTTLKQIALYHGVIGIYAPPRDNSDEFIHDAVNYLVNKNLLKPSDMVIILAGNFGSDMGASFIEICEVQKRLN